MSSMKKWFFAVRPMSFPASMMPALVAFAYAFYLQRTQDVTMYGFNSFLALIAVMLFHASGNLVSDYFDYRKGVDREDAYFGTDRFMVQGVIEPMAGLRFALSLLALACLMGFYLMIQSGWPLLLIGIVGVLGTLFYPYFKYRAFGDVIIVLIFGLSVALGAMFVAIKAIYWPMLIIALPTGFLIENILHANNLRDIRVDKEAGIVTLTMKLGVEGSQILYVFFGALAYVIVVVLVLEGILPIFSLLVFASLPSFWKKLEVLGGAGLDSMENILTLDVQSAQLVVTFSLTLIVGIIIGAFQ